MKASFEECAIHNNANCGPEDIPDTQWNEVGPGTPVGIWLETMREGERGTNVCKCRIMSLGDEPEWIERYGGRTTVTHSTFAAPTHWRWPSTSGE